GARQAGQATALVALSGQARRRPRLGLLARPRRDDRSAFGARSRARPVRVLSFRRTLVRARRANRRSDAACGECAPGADLGLPLVLRVFAVALRGDVPRNDRDALLVEHGAPARQLEIARFLGTGAAHAARSGAALDAARARLRRG